MMQRKKVVIWRVLSICAILFVGRGLQAQTINDLMGKPLNDKHVQELISHLSTDVVESFIPFRKSYKLSYAKSGIELEFNSDLSLYQVNLFDSGYTFGRYEGDLPFNMSWGQDSTSIQDVNGIMSPSANNIYMKHYQNELLFHQMYFKNGGLEHIRIICTPQMVLSSSLNSLSSWGLRLLPDGRVVNGNVIDGEGIMVWGENAASYDGDWMYGLPHGIGTYVDSFGNKYAGEFKLGFFWGVGSYSSAFYNYDYDGMFIMGKRHGKGEMRYKNGIKYTGDWVQDNMEGIGQYSMGVQYYYQGSMLNNSFNGRGILTTPDGYIKGKFKDGKPHGYCEQYANQSTQTLSGYWQNGKKEGVFNLNAFGFDREVIFKNDIEVLPEGN